MANANPVSMDPATPTDEVKAAEAARKASATKKDSKGVDHSQFIGKDHPEFGTWMPTANGWRKDN